MKMAGMPIKQFNEMNYQTFIQQATEFKQLDYDGLNKFIKILTIADATHPWTVVRAAELLNWINEADCVYNKLVKQGKDNPVFVDQAVVDALAKLW